MRNKAILLITLLIASGSTIAEQDMLGNAGKQWLKDTTTSAAPKEAVEGVEGVQDASKLQEGVKSAPDAVKDQAQDMAMESAKKKAEAAVPESTKENVKTLEKSTKSAKKLTPKIPKSSAEATKAIQGKAQEEVTKKALGTLK